MSSIKNVIVCIILSGIVFIPVILFASTNKQIKEVALTFDDGPYGTSTTKILSILSEEHVHATFFLIGKNVLEYPVITKKIVSEGNVIGNHTYDHASNLATSSKQKFKDELVSTEAIIKSTTGIETKYFRPPYGKLSKSMREELSTEGYATVLWNIDPKDWNYASSSSVQIEQRVLRHKKPIMIIVMHDGRDTHIDYPRDNIINALPVIIHDLKEQGYTFVTVDQLSSTTLSQLK